MFERNLEICLYNLRSNVETTVGYHPEVLILISSTWALRNGTGVNTIDGFLSVI